MIPQTYPTFMDARKQAYMKVFFLTSVTGLTKWVDYVPVKTVAFSVANEGTTNTGGHMTVVQVASSASISKWLDYIPVYEDASATVAWGSGSNGYIPVCQMLQMDFTVPVLDSRITFTRADATSCATYFDSTGRLQTAAANVARFDYGPAVPNGTVGGELVTNGVLSTTGSPVAGSSFNSSTGAAVLNRTDSTNMAYLSYTGLTVGKTYAVTLSVSAASTSNVTIRVNGINNILNTLVAGVSGTYYAQIQADGQLNLVAGTNASAATFTVSSVKEVTFAPRGLLIEESRTNLLLQSRDMTQAAWSKTDVTPTRNQVGIDGAANSACLMTEGSAGTAQTFQNGTVAAGSTITISAVLKRGNCDWVRMIASDSTGTDGANAWFNLATGAVGSVTARGAGTSNSSTITSLGGGWYRCTVTTLPNGAYTSAQWRILSATANVGGIQANATYIVDAAQLEVGAFATSIITTTAATVTRAADSASMTGTNFSSWFNATQGTFVAEADQPYAPPAGAYAIYGASDNTANNLIGHRFDSSGTGDAAAAITGGVNQTSLALGGITVGAITKVAHSYDATGRSATRNGLSVRTQAGYTLATLTQLGIGNFPSANPLNGHIRRLTYYPTRLSNAQLQSLTA